MQNVLDAMRAAWIPPYALKTTLPKEGQPRLREFVSDQEWIDADGNTKSYRLVCDNERKLIRMAGVLAKELVLSKKGRVLLASASDLKCHTAYRERHGEIRPWSALIEDAKILVVPDLCIGQWYMHEGEQYETFRAIQQMHYNGTVLIIGECRQGSVGFGCPTFDEFAQALPELTIA